MFLSVKALLLSLAVWPAPGRPAAPVTTKYRVDLKIDQAIDLSSAGQGEQKLTSTAWGAIQVTLTDTAGGRVLHTVIDSAGADLGPMMPIAPEAITGAKGAWIHGLVDAHGKVSNLKSSNDSNVVVVQIKGIMTTFFPRTPGTVKSGDHWTDTTDVENKDGAQNLKIRMVTNYTANGQEAVAGVNALKVATAFSSSTVGTVENPAAGAMDVEGSDSGTGWHLIAPDGRYLGGSSTGAGKTMVKSSMMPEPIPIHIVRSLTVTVVP
jgi:hypothetical protein